jgi:uncharacterized protein
MAGLRNLQTRGDRLPDSKCGNSKLKTQNSKLAEWTSHLASSIAIVVSVLMIAGGAWALEVPYLAGRVNDQADLFGDGFETRLEERLRVLEEETGAQVAVLTIPSLGGDPIEDFSLRVVETWKLGRAGVDDGVLILIARDDRRMRIEVGYGLEGALTDAQSGRIIDRVMAPRFRQGDFEGGVEGAVEKVAAAIRGEELELPEKSPEQRIPSLATLAFFIIFGLPFINAALASRGAAGWVLYFFLTPFFFALPAAIFGAKIGLLVAGAWLIFFPLLRLIVPKAPTTRTGGRGGGVYWGPFLGGGGGGFGGGFSGGGGSFGGGGASGGW